MNRLSEGLFHLIKGDSLQVCRYAGVQVKEGWLNFECCVLSSAGEATAREKVRTYEVNAYPARMPRSFLVDADLDGESRQDVTCTCLCLAPYANQTHLLIPGGASLPREGKNALPQTCDLDAAADSPEGRIIHSPGVAIPPHQRKGRNHISDGTLSNANQQGGKVNKRPHISGGRPHSRPRVLVGEAPSSTGIHRLASPRSVVSCSFCCFFDLEKSDLPSTYACTTRQCFTAQSLSYVGNRRKCQDIGIPFHPRSPPPPLNRSTSAGTPSRTRKRPAPTSCRRPTPSTRTRRLPLCHHRRCASPAASRDPVPLDSRRALIHRGSKHSSWKWGITGRRRGY